MDGPCERVVDGEFFLSLSIYYTPWLRGGRMCGVSRGESPAIQLVSLLWGRVIFFDGVGCACGFYLSVSLSCICRYITHVQFEIFLIARM